MQDDTTQIFVTDIGHDYFEAWLTVLADDQNQLRSKIGIYVVAEAGSEFTPGTVRREKPLYDDTDYRALAQVAVGNKALGYQVEGLRPATERVTWTVPEHRVAVLFAYSGVLALGDILHTRVEPLVADRRRQKAEERLSVGALAVEATPDSTATEQVRQAMQVAAGLRAEADTEDIAKPTAAPRRPPVNRRPRTSRGHQAVLARTA